MSRNRKNLEYYRIPDIIDADMDTTGGNESARFANAHRIKGDITLYVSPPAARMTTSSTKWIEGTNNSSYPDGNDNTADGSDPSTPYATIQAAFDSLSDKIIDGSATVTVQMVAGVWNYKNLTALRMNSFGSINLHLKGTGYHIEDCPIAVNSATRVKLTSEYTDPGDNYRTPTDQFTYNIQYKIASSVFSGRELPVPGDQIHVQMPDMFRDAYSSYTASDKTGLANMCGVGKITAVSGAPGVQTYMYITFRLMGFPGGYMNDATLVTVSAQDLRNLNTVTTGSATTNLTIVKSVIDMDTWEETAPGVINNELVNGINIDYGSIINISYLGVWNKNLMLKFGEVGIDASNGSIMNVNYSSVSGFMAGINYYASSGEVYETASSNNLRGFRAELTGTTVFKQSGVVGCKIGCYIKQGMYGGQSRMTYSGNEIALYYILGTIGRQYFSSNGTHFISLADNGIAIKMYESSIWRFTDRNWTVVRCSDGVFDVDDSLTGPPATGSWSMPTTGALGSLINEGS